MVEGKLGTVRISPQVLGTIARLTALSVPGVLRTYRDLPGGFDHWLRKRGGQDGVRIEVEDGAVTIDIHIVAISSVNLYALGMEIQTLVSRAIQDMVGMPVLAVNVHVQDVESAAVEES